MLDRALMALEGRRLALPVLDTVGLARRLLSGRLARFDLATLADRFSTSVRPCHRALPDALATAELLAALAGRAQERGVDTVEGLIELSEAPVRRVRTRRHLSDAAPRGPGVYVMRDAHGQALYVGKASDLRSRTRSYFGSRRQKPSLEAALLALDRIDTAPLGSELEAALAEIELIQAWRPPANVRDARPDRAVYLRLGLADPYPALGVRGQVRPDGALYAGPLRSKRVADEAATALRDAFALRTCRPRLPVDDGSCLRGLLGRCAAPCRGAPHDTAYADGVERLRLHLEGRGEGASAALAERGAALIAERRFEEAARLRTRRQALASLEATLAQIRRARTRSGLLLAPDLDPTAVRVLAVRDGALAGSWAMPRRGDPSAALAPALASLEPPRPPEGPAEPAPPGPWLPAERHAAALLLAAALAGRDAGVVAQPLLAGTRREDLVRRVGESRARVALRAPVGAGRHRRWRELAALEPPPEASALSA
jgi:DNA polymerase-3 subunit epsilon